MSCNTSNRTKPEKYPDNNFEAPVIFNKSVNLVNRNIPSIRLPLQPAARDTPGTAIAKHDRIARTASNSEVNAFKQLPEITFP